MDLRTKDAVVEVRMTRAEAKRLAWALQAGVETTSRAEYFIRHGLSQPEVRHLVGALEDLSERDSGEASLSLDMGVEEVENPRRPRPDS